MTPYELIADIAERELALVDAGALERLPSLHAERAALLATLPARPPADARVALSRAAATQARVTATLEARMVAVRDELSRLGRGKTAVRGYMPVTAPPRRFDHSG
jgi:hypothetical protein